MFYHQKTRLRNLIYASLLTLLISMPSYATWSIIAVDRKTGEIGIVGASCTFDVSGIASIVPGKGAIVVQAASNYFARMKGVDLMESDASLKEILDAMSSKEFNPEQQQYGLVLLNDDNAPLVYSGQKISDWSGSKIGDDFTGYAFEWTLLNKPKGSAMSIGVLNELNVTFTPDIVGEYEIQVKVTNTTEETIRSLKFDVLEEIIVSESDVTTLDTDKAFDEDIGLVQDQYWVSSKTLSESQLRALVANFSTITADVYDKTKLLFISFTMAPTLNCCEKQIDVNTKTKQDINYR